MSSQRYTQKFREEAVRQVRKRGCSIDKMSSVLTNETNVAPQPGRGYGATYSG